MISTLDSMLYLILAAKCASCAFKNYHFQCLLHVVENNIPSIIQHFIQEYITVYTRLTVCFYICSIVTITILLFPAQFIMIKHFCTSIQNRMNLPPPPFCFTPLLLNFKQIARYCSCKSKILHTVNAHSCKSITNNSALAAFGINYFETCI